MTAKTPPSVLQCLRDGFGYAWSESREFVLLFVLIGVLGIVIGVCAGDSAIVFGGVALLAALAFACIVYGSHSA